MEEVTETFDDVVGHQIGGGVVQIVLPSGVQRIIANFCEVDVIPDDETQAANLDLAKVAYPEEGDVTAEESSDEGSTEDVGN